MGRLAMVYNAKAHISLFAILLCLAGCSPSELEPSFTLVVVNGEPGEAPPFRISSPCGGIIMMEPLANVTGYFSVPVRKGSPVYLYIAPQASTQSALETIRKCPPIEKTAVENDGTFAFPYYPSGDYIVMTPTETFKGEVKHPLVQKTISSGLRVEAVSHLVTSEYALTVFSVQSVMARSG